MQVMAFLQGERDAKPVKAKPKTKGKVIIVGAGPAGLAAALHLKVGIIISPFLPSRKTFCPIFGCTRCYLRCFTHYEGHIDFKEIYSDPFQYEICSKCEEPMLAFSLSLPSTEVWS